MGSLAHAHGLHAVAFIGLRHAVPALVQTKNQKPTFFLEWPTQQSYRNFPAEVSAAIESMA